MNLRTIGVKPFAFLLLFFFICYTDLHADEKVDCKYETFLIGKTKQTVKHGHCKDFYETGKLKSDYIYTIGVLNGPALGYYESGLLQSRTTYKNGQRVHCAEFYYESGALEQKECYANGKLNGMGEWYYLSGQLWRKANFKGGVQNGIAEEYYESGKLKERKYWKDDKKEGIYTEYYESGAIKSRQSYVNGRAVGPPTVYTERDDQEISNKTFKLVHSEQIGVSYDQVMGVLSDVFIMEKVKKGGEIYSGITTDGLAALEIIGNKKNVTSATLLIALPDNAPNVDTRNATILGQFIKNLFHEREKEVFDWVVDAINKLGLSNSKAEEKDFGKKRIRVANNLPVGMTILVKGSGAIDKTKEAQKSFVEEAMDTVYLKNGQVMECHIIRRDANGIWVEVEGGRIYFSYAEIKNIVEANALNNAEQK